MTLRTVPFKIMPGFRSFMSSTSLLKIGAGMLSRGSRDGFSSSFKISVNVISPIPSSTASLLLSLTFFSRLPMALTVAVDAVAVTASLSFFCASASKLMVAPPMAAASAFPIAVFVLRITICFFRSLRLPDFSAFFEAVLPPDGFFAAFFCAVRTSSIVSPSFSRSFMAAS